MHREVLELAFGDKREVDHISGDRLDNRRINLRLVTRQQQAQNVRAHRDSTSRYRGVSWDRRRNCWTSRVFYEGKYHHVGYFADELTAAEAARLARVEIMPFAVGGLER